MGVLSVPKKSGSRTAGGSHGPRHALVEPGGEEAAIAVEPSLV